MEAQGRLSISAMIFFGDGRALMLSGWVFCNTAPGAGVTGLSFLMDTVSTSKNSVGV